MSLCDAENRWALQSSDSYKIWAVYPTTKKNQLINKNKETI